jgi:TetR/AcrR family transcriptional regulator, transcriptional repressor for nem operon
MARPKKFNQEDTLLKALSVFYKKGYAATSINDLVETMHINAPSLYNTYGDKRHLFLLALQAYQQAQHAMMAELLAQSLPAKVLIGQLLQNLIDDSLSDRDRKGCFMVNTTTELANQDEEIFQIVNQNQQTVRSLLADLIQKGQATGEVAGDKNPENLAAYLFTVSLGLRVMAVANPDRPLLEAMLDTVLDTL